MKTALKQLLERTIERLHRSEYGAVALLCLAAIMILLMTVLVMFDASHITQAKIDVQMGADTAAYSAAGTGARSMNMVAFANVGKRTAVGINNMYVLEYPTYVAWVGIQCGCCCNCAYCVCPDITCCLNCSGNGASMIPLIEGWDYISYLLGNDLFKNLEQLNNFQTEVSEISKAWAAGEGQVRGIRNNANMMVVWPDPFSASGSMEDYSTLPIALSEHEGESCLAPGIYNPVTVWTSVEYMVNYFVLEDRSTSSPLWASDGPKEVINGSAHKSPFGPAWLTRAPVACLAAPLFLPDYAAPMFVDVDDSSNPWLSGDDQLRMSTFTWSYKHTPDFAHKQHDKYEFMTRDYTHATKNVQPFPETGMWGMARSEFYFPPPNLPRDVGGFMSGEHEMWLFHPGWMGKLRPVMLPYESTDIASQSWKIEVTDMLGTFGGALSTGTLLAGSIFNISGVPNFDSGGFLNDVAYLRANVAPDMKGGKEFSGGDYHHYLDGTAK